MIWPRNSPYLRNYALGDVTDFLKKLDALLNQNKTIAKGIMLMEEKVREKSQAPQPQPAPRPNFPPQQRPRPLPRY